MKKIFLDCGGHHFEGLKSFRQKGIIDDSFIVHTFEPNPACNITQRACDLDFDIQITPHEKAVWIEDGFVTFNQENHAISQTGSPSDGTSEIDGWGSSIDGIGFEHPGYETQVKVQSVDISAFIDALPEDAYIVCKLDIEGSEFQVLRHLIRKKTIKRISKIFVEFHERFMPAEDEITRQDLIKAVSAMGVDIEVWGNL